MGRLRPGPRLAATASAEPLPAARLPASAPEAAVAGVPGLIRRNTLFLTAAEAFLGTGQQMVPTLGAIMVVQLLQIPALAGLASSALGLTRVLASYPSGQLADSLGRKPVLVLGWCLSLLGAIALGASVIAASVPLFVLGILLFGIGNGTSQQQRRLSAADMYPASRRAEALGFVLTGSVIGALGGPVLIDRAAAIAPSLGVSQLAASWLLVPVLLVPSLALILLIRPDPKTIAAQLDRYYPGLQVAGTATAESRTANVSLGTFFRFYPHRVAFVGMFVLFGNMSMMMAITPLAMADHGMPLSAISLTVAIHVLGMYGASMPLGKLADRVGRRWVLLLGLALSTNGTLLAALVTGYEPALAGLFLVGLGWSCGNVATAALVADTSPADVRGRAMGANSSLSAAASVVAPLLGGVLLQALGPLALVGTSLVFLLPTLVLVAGLREPTPGTYAHGTLFHPAAALSTR